MQSMAAASVGLETPLLIHLQGRAKQSQWPRLGSLKAYPSAAKNVGASMFLCKRVYELKEHRVWSSRKRWLVGAAASDPEDEWGEPGESPVNKEPVVDAPQEADTSEDHITNLKKALIDSVYGSERGLRASSETRAEVAELVCQLEAQNPTPAPTDALALLNGKWILGYTSFSELYALLAAGALPLVKVGEISQTIDSEALTIQNTVSFTGPLTTTSVSASASFEVRSPKRVQVKFEEGSVSTPQFTDSIEIPENVEVLGQKIDLTPLKGILVPLKEAASSLAKSISGQPPIKFPIRTDQAQSWLLTTFLDKDLRIARGDGGSVFVLVKEGSPLLE